MLKYITYISTNLKLKPIFKKSQKYKLMAFNECELYLSHDEELVSG